MAFGIGNLGQIVSDFTESLNQIFGLGSGSSASKMDFHNLDNPRFQGIAQFDATKWIGNTKGPKVRYGFTMMNADEIKANIGSDANSTVTTLTDYTAYYLDIPPQSITQKENFATNIQATRKGIIVESEGVVFKDIILQGTTGVFPGQRGSFNGPQANLSDLTAPPSEPAGVGADGLSKASNVKVVSGYEEFLSLRQYFLKYAYTKTQTNGNVFLIFINEKDNQSLIVEPLEFTMERNSKSPLTYNYRIVMKAIGTLSTVFSNALSGGSKSQLEQILEGIGNVSANLQAGIGQARAAINATSGLFQKTFQAVDQTVNGPLRQVQFALDDLANGISDTMSLPTILSRNFTNTIANIRENANNVGAALGFNNGTDAAAAAAQFTLEASVLASIENDSRITMARSFVEDTKQALQAHSDDLADAFNLGDPLYDSIHGRIPTNDPGPLKVVSDEEFLLLGNIQGLSDILNQVLTTNSAFQSDAEKNFNLANQAFNDPNALQQIPDIDFRKPKQVKQVKIRSNDTLERIALRELRSALRWPEIVILNDLKPPYIDPAGGDGVKKPGDTVLVGVE